jgi:hypothetical protein
MNEDHIERYREALGEAPGETYGESLLASRQVAVIDELAVGG